MPEYVPALKLAHAKLQDAIQYFSKKGLVEELELAKLVSEKANFLILQNAPYRSTISFFQVYSDCLTILELRRTKPLDFFDLHKKSAQMKKQLVDERLHDSFHLKDFNNLVEEAPYVLLVPIFDDQPLNDFIRSRKAPIYYLGLVDRVTRAHGSLNFYPSDFFRHDLLHTELLFKSDVKNLNLSPLRQAKIQAILNGKISWIPNEELPPPEPVSKMRLEHRRKIIERIERAIASEQNKILKRALKITAFYLFHETEYGPEEFSKINPAEIAQGVLKDLHDNWYGLSSQLGPDPEVVLVKAAVIILHSQTPP